MIEFSQYIMKLKENEIRLQELDLELSNQKLSIINRALRKFKSFLQVDPFEAGSIVLDLSQQKYITTALYYIKLFFCLDKEVKDLTKEEIKDILEQSHYSFQCMKVSEDTKHKLLGLNFEHYTYGFFSVHCFDLSYKYEEAEKIAKRIAKLAYKNIVRELNRNILYKEYLALYKQNIQDKKEFEKLLKESFYNSEYDLSRIVLNFHTFYNGRKDTLCELDLYIETEDELYPESYYGPYVVFDQDFNRVRINITENFLDQNLKNIKSLINELFNKHIISGSTFGSKRIFELGEVRDYETY